MKALILAAGLGTRLRPLTNDRPKCMVAYGGKPIINHTLDTLQDQDIKSIGVITGYKFKVLQNHLASYDLRFFHNPNYNSTNMVHSLFCARDFMADGQGDLIISYGDIIYTPQLLQSLLQSQAPISVVVDTAYKALWDQRMDDPLDDLETLKIQGGCITHLGQKPASYDDIHAQYIGLIKIRHDAVATLIKHYDSLNQDCLYEGKAFKDMYMTTLLQHIADHLMPLKAVYTHGGWIEIDAVSDLQTQMVLYAQD